MVYTTQEQRVDNPPPAASGAPPGDDSRGVSPVQAPPRRALLARAALGAVVVVAVVLLAAYAVVPAATVQPARIPRVGFLALGTAGLSGDVKPFQQGMSELGYVEGQNVVVEYRFADGKAERLPELAAELVSLDVDAIVATSSPAIRAAQQATRTIPIVMGISAEPVEQRFVTSLARPGGNITGLTSMSVELSGKRLEYLSEIVPRMARVAVLWDSTYPGKTLEVQELQHAAELLGLQLQLLEARTPADFEGAFEAARAGQAQAMLVLGTPTFHQNHARIAELAARDELPSMHETPHLVRNGGLVAYGPTNDDLFHRSAYFVDRILRGAAPNDLPVERPTRFYLAMNLQTAEALGLTVPRSLLVNAHEVVQ
jgi:putative ABC transport system substrate-binding protein